MFPSWWPLQLGFGAHSAGAESAESGLESVHVKLDNITATLGATLLAASVAPEGTVNRMADMLENVDPLNLLGFKRAGFLVPEDWECEAGVVGGIWPCPTGRPSICRYDLKLVQPWASAGESNVYTDACVHHFCNILNAEHTCCPFFTNLGNDTEIYAEGSVSNVTAGINATQECNTTMMSLDVAWGYDNYFDDPLLNNPDHPTKRTLHYINFEVNRMELGPAFGVQFYSMQGDVLLVRYGGEVIFKPIGAVRNILVNESLQYAIEPNQPSERRQLATDDAPISLAEKLERQSANRHMNGRQRFRGSCPAEDGCPPAAAKKLLGGQCDKNKPGCTGGSVPPVEPQSRGGGGLLPGDAANRVQGRHGRMTQGRRGGGGYLSTTGSFTLSSAGGSNNRGGNRL